MSTHEIDCPAQCNTSPVPSKHRIRPIWAAVVCAGLLSFSQPAFNCQGEDYVRTMQIMQYSYQVGIEFGMTGNVALLQQRLQEIVGHIQTLPPSCQMLIQQMGGGLQGGGSSGTQCMGGVCCDSTGCY